MSRPPFVVRSREVAEEESSYPPPFDAEKLSFGRDLGRAAGSRALGAWRERLAPGRRTNFTHAHLREEELVYVLAGSPSLRWIEPGQEPKECVLEPGDFISFPAATAIAHAIVNRSETDADLLVIGERKTSERVTYPEDNLYEAWRTSQHPLRALLQPHLPDELARWPPARIETERLVLRPWRVEDAHDLLAAQIRNQPHLARWMPWAHELPTLDELHERILSWQIKRLDQRDIVYGVFLPDGRAIGGTGFHDRVGEFGIEIGYWVDFAHERKGYVTEWVSALVRLALERLRVDRVEIHCDPANTRSAAVPLRLGFVSEGTLRRRSRGSDGNPSDSAIFSLYASEWRQTPSASAVVRAWDDLGRRLI